MSGASGGGESDDSQARMSSSNGALQSLLRRLGNGMEDLLPHTHGRARMKELLSGLKEHGDETRQMECLTELCEVLSMGQEEILIGFSVDAFLPVLVDLLKAEHNPEIMLLSCRAITHLLEVIPKSAPKVANCGAVPVFCQRLLTIEFIDVAEQSLMAMHKLSVEHPEPLVRANGLAAALTFIDFFDINTQRTAAATAANICRSMPSDSFSLVRDMMPNLTQLLSSPDQKIVESACMGFSRLVDSFYKSEDHLEEMASHGMLSMLLRLLKPGDKEGRGFDLSTGTYTSVIRTLAMSCRGSPRLAVSLLGEGIVGTVHSIIKKEEDSRLGGSALMTAVAVQRPMEQLFHTLVLANELLPPLATEDRHSKLVEAISSGTEMVQDLYAQYSSSDCLREYATENSSILEEYATLLYPILVDISVTIVNEAMRITCLSAVAKLVASMSGDMLFEVVNESQLLSYLAGFTSSAKPPVAGLSLIISEMLLDKLPDKLAARFAREGVVHEVSRLCAKEPAMADPALDALLDYARHLQEAKFGPGSVAAASGASDKLMQRAREVAERLESGDHEVLKELRELLCRGVESLSSYQVLTSGLGESLLKYLSDPVPGRLQAFIEVFCGLKDPNQLSEMDGATEPFRILVSKLNEALSVRETFPVVLSDASGDLTAGLKLLAQPLKLRLTRDQSDSSIGDYGGNVVLIEPLATINAVHDFLWPKVSQSSSSEAASAGSPEASRSAGSASPPAASASTASENAEEEPDSNADITRPTPSRPNPPSGRTQGSNSNSEPSPPGGSSLSNHSLIFLVNGRPLPYKCPIIQAIGGDSDTSSAGGSAAQAASHLQNCRQAWEQVHTVSYRTVKPDDAELEQSLSQDRSVELSPAKKLRGITKELLSGENAMSASLQDELVLREMGVSSETSLTLKLLTALSIINTRWQILFDRSSYSGKTLVPAGEFINVKLAWKLMRQLQDPLMLCTGFLPPWCADLAGSCHFLFPLECREFFTSCTAFGISRALHSMQQRVQGSSVSDRPTEVRIGRIQREKIRVSRARVLPSAIRALELYASHRSMLEVEYYGEAGTGLGPTLEFYTLVSQELQSAKLGLWRDSWGTSAQGGDADMDTPAPKAADPNDGLGQAPVQTGYIRGFHHICVARCTNCTTITFPRCETHTCMLTKRMSDSVAQCHRCEVQFEGGGTCEHCKTEGSLSLEWWMLSDEEAAYLHAAFPSGQSAIDHILLQCPECKSVNFPGTEQSLIINRGGQMTSMSGRVMHEQDYRAVTRHVTHSCSNLPLTKVPVRLQCEECAIVARLVGGTPEAEEGTDEVSTAGESDRYVQAPFGLFPAPIMESTSAPVLQHFRFLGRLIGKALLDQRNLDLPLSPAIFKFMVGQELTFQDLGTVDPQLYKTLIKMKDLVDERKANSSADLKLDGCALEDLCLDLTMPGYSHLELVPGGKDIPVTGDNLEEYIDLVARTTLVDGVEKQFSAFQAGFDEVFPMRHLQVYSPQELELHIRGDIEDWDVDTLRASIKPDHGFRDTSMPIIWLMNTMASMDRLQRRLFMRFVTGSPTLPRGGLKRLNPRLTVVRKEAEAPLKPDDYLPSVMTCANYLKLPEYTTEGTLKKQLITAMSEGQLSFLLS